mmetsp:Transcript_33789/g.97428  ORF Transcript_33789/g.97428 Transcript_33789/m.97428 type:complete len:98 (-) Transcript_33789:1000-1293(-)
MATARPSHSSINMYPHTPGHASSWPHTHIHTHLSQWTDASRRNRSSGCLPAPLNMHISLPSPQHTHTTHDRQDTVDGKGASPYNRNNTTQCTSRVLL